MNRTDDQTPQPGKPDVQGEGNYDAARKFDAEERAFVEKGDYEGKAKEAEDALDGPEGEDLERARRETAERCDGVVRRQQHAARGEARAFFQMQIGDD